MTKPAWARMPQAQSSLSAYHAYSRRYLLIAAALMPQGSGDYNTNVRRRQAAPRQRRSHLPVSHDFKPITLRLMFSPGAVSMHICLIAGDRPCGVTTTRKRRFLAVPLLAAFLAGGASAEPPSTAVVVLHAARLLDVDTGKMLSPGEVLVRGERIAAVGAQVEHPADAKIIDLGDRTLLPGLIDAHVHLFLHPGAEDAQTLDESVAERTIRASLAAHDDLMDGFTAERDMGTEGAGAADTAVRDAINRGWIPGPRLRICGNAIDILGGHEDAIGFNPDEHALPNATYANSAAELVAVIRGQIKLGADFSKIYETGKDRI